jgi:multicomponent Na+:H+ antiporter subunit D
MMALTIIWIVFPFLAGFIIYLLPRLARYFALCSAIFSVVYTLQLVITRSPLNLRLLDNFGVSLVLDPLSGFFILTNGLVTAAVICYCWRSDRNTFFYSQTLILHGSVNAAFACTDFISLYVALEVIILLLSS